METKKLGSFQKPFLNYMAKSVLSMVFERSAGTMHAILLSMMLRVFVVGSGKT